MEKIKWLIPKDYYTDSESNADRLMKIFATISWVILILGLGLVITTPSLTWPNGIGILFIVLSILPAIIFSLSFIAGARSSGVFWEFDNEKIGFRIFFKNTRFNKIIEFLNTQTLLEKITKSSRTAVYFEKVVSVEYITYNQLPACKMLFKRPFDLFKKHTLIIPLPKENGKEIFEKILVVSKSKSKIWGTS